MISKNCIFIFAFICLFSFGCDKIPHSPGLPGSYKNDGKVKVLSTTAMIGDLVAQVGGDFVDHTILIIGQVDPHSYELVKGDDEKIDEAAAIFYNGLGLEHGASLQYRLQHHPNAIALGDRLLHQQSDKFLYVDGQIDPHIWMDVGFWKEIIPLICETLCKIDNANEQAYRENASAVFSKLSQLDEEIYQKLQTLSPERRYLVTSHDAFNYFAKKYLAEKNEPDWKKRFTAPEGLAPDGQLSTAHLQEIVDYLQKHQVPVVFPESNVNRDSLNKICKACSKFGCKVGVSSQPLFGDAFGDAASGADTYMNMMRTNATIIATQLSKHDHCNAAE
jgi:manganese/zinc/iron transport system substrate-binding protein